MNEVIDRVPSQPGRYKLTMADGSTQYVTLERADEPTVVGTPINKALFDSIADDIGSLEKLPTDDKSSLVAALTEQNSKMPKYMRRGIVYPSNIAVGKTQISVTFDAAVPDDNYIVLAMQNLNYIDIQAGIPSGGKKTTGFTLELWSTRSAAVSTGDVGFAWLAVSLE